MITSNKNQIWGRIYFVGQTTEGRHSVICTSGGPYVKQASMHLPYFDFDTIKIDRQKFAEHLRQHRKNERNKNEQR